MKTPEPPRHLSGAMKRWWRTVTGEYELQDHHLHLLQLACETFDRGSEARKVLDDWLAFYRKNTK